jgi:tetratricopeptide (TPR) repeat protein
MATVGEQPIEWRRSNRFKVLLGFTLFAIAMTVWAVPVLKTAFETGEEELLDELREAKRFFEAEQYKQAILHYSRAIELERNAAVVSDFYRLRGICFSNEKEYERAVKDFTACLKLNPTDALAYGFRASCLSQLKEYQLALEDADKAVQLDPDWFSFYHRATIRLVLRDADGALADYTQVIEHAPDFSVAYQSRSVVWLWKERYQAALEDLEESVRTSPITFPEGTYERYMAPQELSVFLSQCPDSRFRNGQRAVMLALEACKMTSFREPSCLAALASAFAESSDFDEAIKWQRIAIDLSPDGEKEKYQQPLEQLLKKEPIRLMPGKKMLATFNPNLGAQWPVKKNEDAKE